MVDQDLVDQGTVYLAYTQDQLKAEWHRRTRIDAQGAHLQQASAVAAGVVVSATGILAPREATVPAVVLFALLGSVACLMGAFVLGIFAQYARRYSTPGISTLEQMVTDHWGDTVVDSRNQVANLNINTIKTLRLGTTAKVKWIIAAQVVLTLGVASGLVGLGVLTLAL